MKTYFRGGTRRLAAGLMPLSNAFLACIIKCLVGDFETIVSTNLPAEVETKIKLICSNLSHMYRSKIINTRQDKDA